MATQPTYNDGTVTISSGSNVTTVTGSGTQWAAYVKAGDYFWANGLSVRIAAVVSNTVLTLASAWPGGALSGAAYEISYTPNQQVAQAKTTSLLGMLSNGNLSALAALTTAADKLAYYTGAGVAALIDFKSWARSFLSAADAAAGRTALGLGSIATRAAPSGTVVGDSDTQTLANKKLSDSTTTIIDSADATKIGAFELSGVSSGTVRTLTWPNASGTIMTRETAESITGLKGISRGTATTAVDYLQFIPTDWATGKPGFYIGKGVIQDRWNLILYDGVNSAGSIRFSSGSFLSEGVYATTTAAAANVNVASDGTLARSTSSEKYKANIEPMTDEWADKILNMEPIWYRSTCEIDNASWSYWGLSAEAVAEIDPRLVHWRTHEVTYETRETQVKSTERFIASFDERIDDETGEVTYVPVYDEREVTHIETVVEPIAVPLEEPIAEGVAYERLTCHLISVAKRDRDARLALEAQLAALAARVAALEAASAWPK